MKKRIVCVLLTLIMLLSLVPMGASAASNKTSEAAITVLKQMTSFKSVCYYFTGTEFRTGYGTVCENDHHFDLLGNPDYSVLDSDGKVANYHSITEAKADLALRKALLAIDEKVNTFASANGLSLSQNQHDALVVFSYDAGTDWMNGNGVLKSTIVNGCDANELLNAMNQWTNNAHKDRRKVEVNMYMNGIYTNTVPSSYGQVSYNPNGGSMPQQDYYVSGDLYTYYYELNKTMEHPVVPTKAGCVFLGWYMEETFGPSWAPALTSVCNGKTLVAMWQTLDAKPADALHVYYDVAKSHLGSTDVYDFSTGKVNANWTDALAKELAEYGTVPVDRDYIDSYGNRWSHIRGGNGWVMVGKQVGGSVGSDEVYVDVIVTVTNSRLNRRVNASISSATNGSYSQGAQLRIINTEYEDGYLWGQVAASETDNTPIGWVALMYTNWNSVKDNDNAGASTNNGAVIGTATVTVNGYLNLRNEPGTDGKIVGALAKNDTVELYEIKTVNGQQWGRCKSGWLCLTYTRVLLRENVKISDEGALTYAFTGVYNGTSDLVVRVEPNANSNAVTYYIPNAFDPAKADNKADLYIPKKTIDAAGTSVLMTNMFKVDGKIWVKATWQNPEWDWKTDRIADGTKNFKVTRSGWVEFDQIDMNPADFTVVANTVNVRTAAGDGSKLAFTLNKGVQVRVDEISLENENLWGHIHVKLVNHVGVTESKEGWVNLASKYFSRDGAPTVEENNAPADTNLIATVVGTDSLKVRSTGASYGTQIGKLSRGTVVTVWESNEDDWYKVDSNRNGVYDYEEDGWCSGTYLEIREGTVGGNSTVTDSNGNKYQTDGTGKGVVANTYTGVNVRTGPGTGYPTNGKLLTGTVVEILETANGGKWGRTAQGWVSMDYITMVSYNEVIENTTPNGGTTVESFDKADKTTTTAVYPGAVMSGVTIYRTPEVKESEIIRTTSSVENVTMYELATVTKVISSDIYDHPDANKTTINTTTTVTTYWARINDGWILNPQDNLVLTALDEKVHTQTGATKLNVRKSYSESAEVIDVLLQGDQVNVTALQIVKDKVWGRIETNEGTGWIRLDYMSEGAVYVKAPTQNNNTTTTTPSAPVLGNTSSTGGYVNNSTGYRYTGKVIRANEVNVRANPSTTAAKTTSLKNGAALVIYETTVAENMAWGRCDAGWIYLYYVDLTPVVNGAVDARVVYNDNTIIYTDVNGSAVAGTYARMSVIDIYEIVGKMARTDLGWVDTDNLL